MDKEELGSKFLNEYFMRYSRNSRWIDDTLDVGDRCHYYSIEDIKTAIGVTQKVIWLNTKMPALYFGLTANKVFTSNYSSRWLECENQLAINKVS